MATLTITVDPEVLRRARIRALERNESVNKYLNEMLVRYAQDESASVVAEFLAHAERFQGRTGSASRGWTRDELYDG